MSKINDLIQKLCPFGIKYEKLGNVCDVVVGFSFKSNLFKSEGLPIVKTTNIQDGYIDETNMVYFDQNDYSNNLEKYIIYPNDIVLGMSGTIKVGINNTNKNYYLNQRVCKFKPHKELNNKFLYYMLSNSINELLNATSGSSVKNLSNNNIRSLQIAVPPLEVQDEIVQILDDFTLLSAELSAELKARKKQYNYYLNDLLDLNKLNSSKIMDVKDLFEIKNGLNKEKSAFGKGTPIVNFTDVYNNRYLTADMLNGKVTLSNSEIERYEVKKGDVFFTRTSETKEDIGMSSTVIEDIPNCTFSGFVLRARPITNLLLPKFCAYYFSTNQVRENIVRYSSFTTRATTSGPKLSKIPVPIIPIKEQEKIVNILDRFDRLCNDISNGLPAEIEARQKQYEYYRDKLLTFKEKKDEQVTQSSLM